MATIFSGPKSKSPIPAIARYGAATLTGIYPGIDAQYTNGSPGVVTLNLRIAPGANLQAVQFTFAPAASITIGDAANLTVLTQTQVGHLSPRLVYNAPVATQGSKTLPASFSVSSSATVSIVVNGQNTSQPLQISIVLSGPTVYSPIPTGTVAALSASDSAGSTYYAATIADTPTSAGCGTFIEIPVACTDTAIYKYSVDGALSWLTFLQGSLSENPGFLGIAPNGSLVVAGTTDSADFPIPSAAAQSTYAAHAFAPEHLQRRRLLCCCAKSCFGPIASRYVSRRPEC